MRWLFIILLLSLSSQAQVKQQFDTRPSKEIPGTPSARLDGQNSVVLAVFKIIENGIKNSSVKEFDKELGAMVSIALGYGEHGYFSMNQAALVLTEYFAGRRIISFEFSRIHEKGVTPYATGRLVYIQKGNQESVQVYVSLTRKDSRWVVNQFNIY